MTKDWRVWLLHFAAKALGVLFHHEGFPYGSRRGAPAACTGSTSTTRVG